MPTFQAHGLMMQVTLYIHHCSYESVCANSMHIKEHYKLHNLACDLMCLALLGIFLWIAFTFINLDFYKQKIQLTIN